MTRVEFLKVAAYLAAGCGKALEPESLEVYFDRLGDLPADAFLVAAKRVLLSHKYPTFPSIAELREAAAETLRGTVAALTPAAAWETAWRVAGDTDPEIEGSFDRAVRKAEAPPLVVAAIKAFGLQALCYGKEPVGVVRGQFLAIFEQLRTRERRAALLPASTVRAIEDIGRRALPEKAVLALGGICKEAE